MPYVRRDFTEYAERNIAIDETEKKEDATWSESSLILRRVRPHGDYRRITES